jgi:hypothetical protein
MSIVFFSEFTWGRKINDYLSCVCKWEFLDKIIMKEKLKFIRSQIQVENILNKSCNYIAKRFYYLSIQQIP